MRMSAAHDGLVAVVTMTGRLDGESARHLSDTIEDLLRDGARTIELDMAGVTYLSSAAARVLARRSEDLSTLRGSLQVVAPSDAARALLAAAGLGSTLIREGRPTRLSISSGKFTQWGLPAIDAQHGSYEVSHYAEGGVAVRVIGSPESPLTRPSDPARAERVEFPLGSFGLGLGAIADSPEEALPRVGEFIAAEGVIGYLPTDGATVPDFMVSYAERVPAAVLTSGLVWQGMFTDLIRYSTQPNSDEIPLAELCEVCLEMGSADALVLATVAEVRGLIGASLRVPPTQVPAGAALRDCVSFTPEPAYPGTTALIVGVVARGHAGAAGVLGPYLRPLDAAGTVRGHLHAAVFPYSPVPQRTVMLPALVGRLFQTLPLRAVLHLVQDLRPQDGAGTTSLLRGVCWTARVTDVEGAG